MGISGPALLAPILESEEGTRAGRPGHPEPLKDLRCRPAPILSMVLHAGTRVLAIEHRWGVRPFEGRVLR